MTKRIFYSFTGHVSQGDTVADNTDCKKQSEKLEEPKIISIDFKGIEMKLRIGKWTQQSYASAMGVYIARFPDMLAPWQLREYSCTTFIYLAHFNYCEMNDMPCIYIWEDIHRYVQVKLMAPDTAAELETIIRQHIQQ